MDLAIWLPSLFLLGVATLGLLTAFVVACDKI
jgi:hypothetical protein